MAHTLSMHGKRNHFFCLMAMIVVLLSCKKVDIAPAATPTPTPTTTPITDVLDPGSTICVMPGAERVAVFSSAKSHLVSAVCNGKFYYTDGNTIDVFDPSTNTILLTKYLSKPRNHVSAITVGDKVFFAGGYVNRGSASADGEFISIVDIYNTSTGTWTNATLSAPRIIAEGASCTIGNKVFFAGGITHTNEGSSRLDIYDLSTGSWTHRDLAVPGTYVTAVVENKVWFVTAGTSRVEVYDNATDTWGSITFNSPIYNGLPKVLSYNKAIRLGTKIYFTGYQRVPVYDIVTSTWSEISLSESKVFIPAVVSGGKIVFVGGMTSWFVYSNYMEVYDPVTNSFTTHAMSKDLFYEALISYNDYIYTAGGMVDQENTRLSSICRFRL